MGMRNSWPVARNPAGGSSPAPPIASAVDDDEEEDADEEALWAACGLGMGYSPPGLPPEA